MIQQHGVAAEVPGMGRSKNRKAHDSVDFLNRYVVRVRRGKQCKECGRTLPQGLFLAGDGIQLARLARMSGGTLDSIKREIRSRGWVCRHCLNQQRGVVSFPVTGYKSQAELLRDPKIRRKMEELGIAVPREEKDNDTATCS